MAGLLWAIVVILVLFWLAGVVLDLIGGVIHILLVIAIALIIWNVLASRRAI